MLSTFLDRAEALLNKRFLVAYWFPTFVAVTLALAMIAWAYGWAVAWTWWQAVNADVAAPLWLLLAYLLAVTVLAYLLQAFTRSLIQLYEGYGLWPERLRVRRIAHYQQRRAALVAVGPQDPVAWENLYHGYPPHDQVLPTRLGNTIRAAEAYSDRVYGIDLPVWWPRLWAKLPEDARQRVEDALTGIVALLNLASLFFLLGWVALLGGAWVSLTRVGSWWRLVVRMIFGFADWFTMHGPLGMVLALRGLRWGLLFAVLAWLLAWLSYEGAVAQARSYGQRLRTAVDLYRFELLKALNVPLPKTPREERQTWGWLTDWLYSGTVDTALDQTYAHAKQAPEEKKQDPPRLVCCYLAGYRPRRVRRRTPEA